MTDRSGSAQGRITIYATAESLDRELLATKLLTRGPNYLLQVRSPGLHRFASSLQWCMAEAWMTIRLRTAPARVKLAS